MLKASLPIQHMSTNAQSTRIMQVDVARVLFARLLKLSPKHDRVAQAYRDQNKPQEVCFILVRGWMCNLSTVHVRNFDQSSQVQL